MTTKTYKGKQYETGKYYEFSDDNNFTEKDCLCTKLKDVLEGESYPFTGSFGASYRYCREINPDSLGKITKPKIVPEVGKYYKILLGSNIEVIQWREGTIMGKEWEMICEMVEKE